MTDKLRCSCCFQLFAIAEAPEAGDASQACVTSRLDINLRIANIDRLVLAGTKLTERKFHHIWSGFQSHTFTLTDGHINNIAKICIIEFVDACLEFVADNSSFVAPTMNFLKHLPYSWIKARIILTMKDIVLPKKSKAAFVVGLRRILGNSSLNELPHAISHKATHFVERTFTPIHLAQSVIDAIGKVLQRVGQSAIEIENDTLYQGGEGLRMKGEGLLNELHHPTEVFADDVKFEINHATDFNVVEIGILVGVRNDAHFELIVRGTAHRKAYTVDRNTSFVDSYISATGHLL